MEPKSTSFFFRVPCQLLCADCIANGRKCIFIDGISLQLNAGGERQRKKRRNGRRLFASCGNQFLLLLMAERRAAIEIETATARTATEQHKKRAQGEKKKHKKWPQMAP